MRSRIAEERIVVPGAAQRLAGREVKSLVAVGVALRRLGKQLAA